MIINPLDNVEVREDGHKYALRPIAEGENVIKYGMPIGRATAGIGAGEHVHVHNVKTNLGDCLEYEYRPDASVSRPAETAAGVPTILAYRRKDGRVGIRNKIWVVPTVGCVNNLAERLAAAAGGLALTHPYGCSQLGDDHEMTANLLAALCRHPNAGGVLVLHLGCENITPEQFRAELGELDPSRIKFLVAQEVEDEIAEGSRLLAEIAQAMANDKREDVDASELVVGMKCGGSE